MNRRDIPNIITIARILLVVPVGWLIVTQRYHEALVLFFIAGASDGVDGFLAKHYGWTSRLGGILDPLADKLLLLCCFATLSWNGLIPLWLLALVIMRDIVIVTGAVVYHFRVGPFEAEPTWISKLNTVLQIVLVLLIVLIEGDVWGQPAWVEWLIAGVTLTTLWSGLDYVLTWSRRARQAR